jgi:hypothetical protein
MKNRKRSLWLSLLALAAALAAVATLLFQEPTGDTRRLPNGVSLSLMGLTIGTAHRYDGRRPIDRLVALARPDAADPRVLACKTPSPMPTFWVRARMPPRKRGFTTLVGRYEFKLADEHGCRFAEPNVEQFLRAGQQEWYALSFPGCPRRAERVVLQAWEQNSLRLAAAYDVPNPFRRTVARLKPEPYPIVRSGGDFRFRLDRIQKYDGGLYGCALATLACTDPSHPGSRWDPVAFRIADAAGLQITSESGYDPKKRQAVLRGLCFEDDAWKLRVELARPYGAVAPPDFEWRFNGVAVPPRFGGRPTRLTSVSHGVTLHLAGVASAGTTGNLRGREVRTLYFSTRMAVGGTGARVTLAEVSGSKPEQLFRRAALPFDP